MQSENEKKFLEELSSLSLKYNIYIKGCGCCGSPYLKELKEGIKNDGQWDDGDLKWNNTFECYTHD
jgi:hypothetical protein